MFTVQYDKYSIGAFPNFEDATKYIYIKSTMHSVCPSLELGLPQPLSRQRVCPTPRTKGWGAHWPAAKGVGGSPNADDWRKSLALCLLCERMVAQGLALKRLKEERARRGERVGGHELYRCTKAPVGPLLSFPLLSTISPEVLCNHSHNNSSHRTNLNIFSFF